MFQTIINIERTLLPLKIVSELSSGGDHTSNYNAFSSYSTVSNTFILEMTTIADDNREMPDLFNGSIKSGNGDGRGCFDDFGAVHQYNTEDILWESSQFDQSFDTRGSEIDHKRESEKCWRHQVSHRVQRFGHNRGLG